jgi:flagellar motor switch protein FliN/FliY
MDKKVITPVSRGSAKSIELVELSAERSTNKPAFGAQLELIENVKVSLSALVGRCELTVAELFALKEGAVLPLDRDTREPVDIYLDGRLVGRAELVVVGDNFGLRIVELRSSSAE